MREGRVGLRALILRTTKASRTAAQTAPLAGTTAIRRGQFPTENLYVKLPCPSAFTSYSKVQFRQFDLTLYH